MFLLEIDLCTCLFPVFLSIGMRTTIYFLILNENINKVYKFSYWNSIVLLLLVRNSNEYYLYK